MDMTLNGVVFHWSEVCQEYQLQATTPEEYEKAQVALVSNGWELESENDWEGNYAKDNQNVYVERNY